MLTGDGATTMIAVPRRGEIVVGRAIDADAHLDDPSLSRHHAALEVRDEGLVIRDLGSKNGTVVGGARLARDTPTPLALGAVAELGTVLLTVVERDEAPLPRRAQSAKRQRAPRAFVATPGLAAALSLVERVAATDLPVLLLGETGVGKDVLAERLHAASPRSGKRLVSVNAAALSESLFESEVFGHEQGAFTGATRARAGVLESSDGGTLFLDEIGELSLSLQVKLLRVLDERRVQRVGGTTSRRVDVRFVTATNRDLADDVRAGTFRKDLYHRLRGVVVAVPALRDRRADIPLLADAFLEATAPGSSFADDAKRALAKHPFFGNVRELKNLVERSALLAKRDILRAADLAWDEAVDVPATAGDPDRRDGVEVRRIEAALAKTGGNQTEAARILGMSRRSLVYKLAAFGIARPRRK
ncbi:MAG: sigma 54-interacting transcriptional regulator [Deltaproteobacteria bacterium]|nr:sigma 54-interacting transcriptional regulator [Deltaproteobacteria bacterium]